MKLLLSSLCFVAAFVPQSTQGFSVVSNSKTLDTTTALFSATTEQPGTAELDKPWTELGFEFRPTNSHLRMTFKDGEWGAPELVKVCVIRTTQVENLKYDWMIQLHC